MIPIVFRFKKHKNKDSDNHRIINKQIKQYFIQYKKYVYTVQKILFIGIRLTCRCNCSSIAYAIANHSDRFSDKLKQVKYVY